MNITELPSSQNFLELTQTNLSLNFQKEIDWQNFTDQDLERYQNHLNSLTEALDSESESDIQSSHQTQLENDLEPLMNPLRFKDLFFDFLQGQNHQISYLGQSTENYPEVETEIIKQFASILFKIGQQEKTFYPHLLTHIKEQFYKPNIFQKIYLSEQTKQNYAILIDIFFNEAHENSSYDDFTELYPDFQDICVIVFRKIAVQETKRIEPSSLHQISQIKTKAFQMIQKFCSKFLIEMNYFGYDEPSIQIIALANEERFVFLCQSNHLFLLTLEKFDLLTVRRKSSHNISVYQKNEKDLRRSSHNQKQKKNSWNQLEGTAHFRTGQASQHMRDFLVLNVIDSDQTSNYESSILKSESKMHQLSDQSTPKFKHSSIAHIRKKSHKDSFGGVDFDNMVYKDLANPKRYADKKGSRQKDHNKNQHLNTENYNKKVLSERFETHELQSLTYGDDEDSSIEFVPHFPMIQGNEKGNSASVFGNSPTSPAYSNNNYSSFSNFIGKFEFQQNKSKLIKKMKGSNIQKTSQFYCQQQDLPQTLPQFKHQNSNHSNGKSLRIPHSGNRVLASSQIIEFTGSYDQHQQQLQSSQRKQDDENQDFLIIPSMNSRFNHNPQHQQKDHSRSFTSTQKDVFMSFSKNDKEKFLIPDSHEIQNFQYRNKFASKRQLKANNQFQAIDQPTSEQNANNVKTRKYSYHTQKEERQKFRNKQRLQKQTQISQTNSFISEHTPASFTKKHQYRKYHEIYTTENNIFNQFDSASQINLKNSHTFTNQENENNSSKLQRKHSSNIPLYKAAEPQENHHRSRYPQINFNSKNANKRFEQNSVRFSQVIQNNDDEIFYVQKRDDNRQSFGNRKQRKVTDFYEGPLVNLSKGGNRASQIIQNGVNSKSNYQPFEHRFEGHLDISHDNSNVLINSGGGKNYSVISNISYDEERRIEDLLQIQNQHALTNNKLNTENQKFNNFSDQQIDFANIQAIQRLIVKKKQQKIRLNSQQLSVSIQPNKNNVAQPQDWVKKEVFYFFQSSPYSNRAPEKHVILNSERPQHKLSLQNSKSHSKRTQKVHDFPSSSTSLYNFSILKQQNPQFQAQRDKSVSKKSLGDRKYSVKEMKPASQAYLNCYSEVPIQKLNSSPYINTQNVDRILTRQEYKPALNDFDKMSIYTQPLPRNNIKINTINRPQPIQLSQQSIHIPMQNLNTYPSQPIIRFTVGNSPSKTFVKPQPMQTYSNYTPLANVHSQSNLNTYRIN